MKENEKELIKTIYHQNVKDFFTSIGCFSDLKRGKIRCTNCGKTLTLDNFKMVTKKSGQLLFCCDDENCLNNFSLCQGTDV